MDFPLPHERPGHVIGNQCHGNLVLHELPGRQPGTLQNGTRLIRDDLDLFSLLPGRADHTQRGPVAGGRQRAGVTMSQHSLTVLDQPRSMLSHRFTERDVFLQNELRLFHQRRFDRGDRLAAQRGQLRFHAFDRPKEVYRRRPRCSKPVADHQQRLGKNIVIGRYDRLRAECDAHGGSDTDGRRSPHFQLANRLRDSLHIAAVEKFDRPGQTTLIEQTYRAVFPFNGRDHAGIL